MKSQDARRSTVWALLALVLPPLLHLARFDVAVPLLLWLAAAALLRSGETLTDRLVLAGAALASAACAAGLLLSVWPWHLAPVPVGMVAGVALVLVAVVTRRRPTLRLPVTARDVAVWCAAATAAAIAFVPLLRTSGSADRVGMVVPAVDLSRHFVIYDAIGRVGGYLFLRPPTIPATYAGLVTYPQGSHFVIALLDGFARGGRPPGGALVAFDHFLVWTGVTVVAFAACLTWAAGWLLRRVPRGWWAVPLYALVLSVGVWTIGAQLLGRGYLSELAGLALLTVVLALVVGAGAEGWTRERVVLTAAGVVGICFVYYFDLFPLALVLAYAAWVGRRELWTRRRSVAVLAIAGAALAAVMPVISVFAIPRKQVLLTGPVIPVSRVGALLLTLAVVAPFAAPTVRRHPLTRAAGVALLGALGFAAAVGGVQWAKTHALSYYFEKSMQAVVVAELVTVGAIAAVLAGGAAAAGRSARRRPGVRALVGVLAAVGVFAAFGVVNPRPTHVAPSFLALPAGNFGRAYLESRLALPREGRGAVGAFRTERAGASRRLVLFWGAYGPLRDYYAEQFANALDRRFDQREWRLVQVFPVTDWPLRRSAVNRALARLGSTPTTIYTRQAMVAEAVIAYATTHPFADLRVQQASD